MTKLRFVAIILLCTLSGLLNGFLGGGGGVLTVTVLLTLFSLSQKHSQATAMAIILPVSAVSAVVYAFNNKLPLLELGLVSLGVAIGGVLGALLLNKLNSNVAKLIFALFLVLGGIKMLLGV